MADTFRNGILTTVTAALGLTVTAWLGLTRSDSWFLCTLPDGTCLQP